MGTALTLEQWLNFVMSENPLHVYPHNKFPTDQMKEEYLDSIGGRAEDDVKRLLRRFLIQTGRFGQDTIILDGLHDDSINNKDLFSRKMKFEFYRRLISSKQPWEGNTWVLDLLPHFPRQAIDSISCYFLAHAQFLPDDCLDGLDDAMAIIRAKYLHWEHPRETLLNLYPRQFERVIGYLFTKMGYKTELTPTSHDGGVDVIATQSEPAKKQTVIIQCKRFDGNVGVTDVRDLLGTVTDRKATKGILVCTSSFTKHAIRFADNNPRIELIDFRQLNKLLNEFEGPHWHRRIDATYSRP